jgi:hypothetical protein
MTPPSWLCLNPGTRQAQPFASRMTFSGSMSRWITPSLCANSADLQDDLGSFLRGQLAFFAQYGAKITASRYYKLAVTIHTRYAAVNPATTYSWQSCRNLD